MLVWRCELADRKLSAAEVRGLDGRNKASGAKIFNDPAARPFVRRWRQGRQPFANSRGSGKMRRSCWCRRILYLNHLVAVTRHRPGPPAIVRRHPRRGAGPSDLGSPDSLGSQRPTQGSSAPGGRGVTPRNKSRHAEVPRCPRQRACAGGSICDTDSYSVQYRA